MGGGIIVAAREKDFNVSYLAGDGMGALFALSRSRLFFHHTTLRTAARPLFLAYSDEGADIFLLAHGDEGVAAPTFFTLSSL